MRQALTFAINKSQFDGEIATSPISSSSWAFNELTKRYNYNTGKSKELLAKVPKEQISITLHYSPGLIDLANQIKEDWQDINIDTELVEFVSNQQEFQALLAINEIMPDPDQYGLWHSTQKETNITGYANPKVDKLLEDARIVSDEEERKLLYLEFQEEIMEDLPAAFLYYPYKYKATYKNIKPLLKKIPISL